MITTKLISKREFDSLEGEGMMVVLGKKARVEASLAFEERPRAKATE